MDAALMWIPFSRSKATQSDIWLLAVLLDEFLENPSAKHGVGMAKNEEAKEDHAGMDPENTNEVLLPKFVSKAAKVVQ